MQFSIRYLATAALALLLGMQASTPAFAAATYCPQRSSIFGTVVEVHPDRITIHTSESAMGDIHVMTRGAHVHANGLALAPGVYAGIYGCLSTNNAAFRAEEVTLATSANAYNGYRRRVTTLEGRVDAVQSGRVLLDTRGHGDIWVYTSRGDLKTGELIRAVGTLDPRNSAFVATSIDIERP